jgi:hypothetical protein
MSKYLQTSLAAVTHLAEGLCFNKLLTLKVENSLICLVGTRIPTVSKMEGQFIFPLKTSIFLYIKANVCVCVCMYYNVLVGSVSQWNFITPKVQYTIVNYNPQCF